VVVVVGAGEVVDAGEARASALGSTVGSGGVDGEAAGSTDGETDGSGVASGDGSGEGVGSADAVGVGDGDGSVAATGAAPTMDPPSATSVARLMAARPFVNRKMLLSARTRRVTRRGDGTAPTGR
jgi:hypothetical protein